MGAVGQPIKVTDGKSLTAELSRIADICHGCRRCFSLCPSFDVLFKGLDVAGGGRRRREASDQGLRRLRGPLLRVQALPSALPVHPAAPVARRHPAPRPRRATGPARGPRAFPCASGCSRTPTGSGASPRRSRRSRTSSTRFPSSGGPWRRRRVSPRGRSCRASSARRSRPGSESGRNRRGRRSLRRRSSSIRPVPSNGTGRRSERRRSRSSSSPASRSSSSTRAAAGCPSSTSATFRRRSRRATDVVRALLPWVEKGYTVVTPGPSCSLMIKKEYPWLGGGEDVDTRREGDA